MAQDPVRDEAERLVAAAVAAVSLAARGLGGAAGSRFGGSRPGGLGGFATGSPECCVCPVCRVIAAMREPSPDLAERLATGAGDLATAVTGLLRTFSRGNAREDGPGDNNSASPGRNTSAGSEGDEFWDNLRQRARGGGDGPVDADPWHTATRTAEPSGPDLTAPKPMAKKAVRKAAKKAAPVVDAPTASAPATAPAKKVVKKTAKKAVKKAAPPGSAE
jgi:hypothetical protein